MSLIFGVDGKIKNTFIAALWVMNSGSVPRWNGNQFITGTIQDNGVNIGIGTSPTSHKLEVLWDARISQTIKTTEICDENGLNCWDLSAVKFGSLWYHNWDFAYYDIGNVGIGTNTPGEVLSIIWRMSLTTDPNSWDDVGNRDYNDTRYINVWESWDLIADGTIDSSEIEDNSLTSNDIAVDAVGGEELANNSVSSMNIVDNTITEFDISDSFKARDTDLFDNIDSTGFARAWDRTDNYVWVRRSSTNPAIYITNQSTWRIAEFRSGVWDGIVQSYIDNTGNLYAPMVNTTCIWNCF